MINKRMLIKFILSYITILIIPIIVFTLVVKTYTLKEYEARLINNNHQVIKNITGNLASQINSLTYLANQLRIDDDFSSYKLEKKRVTYLNIEEKVTQYTVLNDFAYEMFFSTNTTSFLYGALTYDIDRYCNDILINPDFSSNQYKALFTSASTPTWVPMNQVSLKGIQTDITSFIVPVERSMVNNLTKSTMIFHITRDNINQIVAPLLQDSSSKVIVEIDDVIIYTSDDHFLEHRNTDNSEMNYRYEDRLVNIDNRKYFHISHTDSTTGLTLTQYFDLKQFKTSSNSFLMVAYLALFGSVVLGFLFMLIALRYTYQPIKRLSEYAKALSSSNFEEMGELDSTRHTLDELQHRNQIYNLMNMQYKRERTILKLASNTAGDREALLKECIEANIDTFCNYYICITIDLNFNISDSTYFNKEAFITYTSQRSDIYFSEIVAKNNLILIVSSEFDDYIHINNLLDEIVPTFFITNTITMGIGNFTDSIYTLNPSYCQSLIALNRAMTAHETTGYFHKIKTLGNRSLTYDRKDLRNFYNAIASLDRNKIRGKGQRLKEGLRLFPEADHVWIYIAHDIVNTAIQALDEQDVNAEDLFNKYTYLLNSKVFTDPEQVNNIIDELVSDVLNLVNDVSVPETVRAAVKSQLDITEIHEFILANYKDPNISVKSIAQDFNTSMSNLSHFFKGKMGKNISAYINELRINEAKRLLTTTTMTISEIVEIIGGNYASSFIRNFKKSTGMTPGDFREKAD